MVRARLLTSIVVIVLSIATAGRANESKSTTLAVSLVAMLQDYGMSAVARPDQSQPVSSRRCTSRAHSCSRFGPRIPSRTGCTVPSPLAPIGRCMSLFTPKGR